MGKLQVLPSQIANMIAAGEVVQRPASVVKELVENAIDAGADKINVVLTDSGRTLIQVVDNGCGMSPADAVLCFERHATSKIAGAEDLEKILTYGFRGEALASIAAVAEVVLKTKREQDEAGVQVTVSEWNNVKSSPSACPRGCNFSVRNLFYNTPARRKFLKSDNVELRHCIEELTRVAIPHPEIEFSLTNNGRDILVLKNAKTLKFRILDVLGSNVVGDVVDIETETTILKIRGFIGKPEASRKTPGNQFFFVRGRFFKSPYLHSAVNRAYEGLIPEGTTPAYFLFLDIDPSRIDVNIHPTKTEIKFEDESVIYQIVYAAVKEALGRNAFGASIDFEEPEDIQMPQLGNSFSEYKGAIMSPDPSFDAGYNPFSSEPQRSAAPSYSSMVGNSQNYGALFENREIAVAKTMVIKGKYILTPSTSGLMIVNARRAWERILYERCLKALSSGEHVSQAAMFPVQIQVGAAQAATFAANAELLSSLGFDIRQFGPDTIAVEAVPEGYSCERGKVEQMIQDLLLVLSEESSALPEMIQSATARKFATLGAINSTVPDNPSEAQALLDSLFACDNAELTPFGKKTVTVLSSEEIEKLF